MLNIHLRPIARTVTVLIVLTVSVILAAAQQRALLAHEFIRAMAWSPDNTLLAIGHPEGWLSVMDAEGREMRRWQADLIAIASIAWSSDGEMLATSGAEGTIRLWDTTTWELSREMGSYSYGAFHIVWTPDNAILIGSGFDTFQAWDAISGEPITDRLSVSLDDMKWRPNSATEFAVTGGYFAASYTLDEKLEGKYSFFSTEVHLSLHTLDWNADGTRLVVAGREDAVRVWDGDTGELLAEIPAREHFIREIAFVSDTQAVGVTEGGAVVLADFERQTLSTLAQFDAALTAMAWNPQLARLDVGGYTRTLQGESEEARIDGFLDSLDLSEAVAAPATP